MNKYTKTLWVDHLVENPDKYSVIYNADNSITLSPLEGEIYQEGTPINAINLNKIEEGVFQAHTGEINLGSFQGESRKLVLRKGKENTITTLTEGELGYATDTRKLFVGTSLGNALVVPDIDVTGAVEEVIDRRVNHVKNKSLSQVLLEETRSIYNHVTAQINSRINSITNKTLNQIIDETNNNQTNVINNNINTQLYSLTTGIVPVVKSVQRGAAINTWFKSPHFINIYPVNPSKSIILFEGVPMSSSPEDYKPLVTSLISNGFWIHLSSDNQDNRHCAISWQVVEFF